jgi:hypothetical protein
MAVLMASNIIREHCYINKQDLEETDNWCMIVTNNPIAMLLLCS